MPDLTGMDDFVEVYALATGRKQRVPRHYLDDPVLSLGIRKTPSQRELDGDLPDRPTQDSTVKEIDKYADAVGIDFPGDADKTAKLNQVEAVFAHADTQEGLIDVEVEQRAADPLAPQNVAQGDPRDVPGVAVTGAAPTTTTDGTESPDETPAAGDPDNQQET